LIWVSVKSEWPVWLIVNHNGHWMWSIWLSFGHLDRPLAFLTRYLVCHMVKNVTLVSNVLIKSNLCLSCPKHLVKTTIPLGQCEHFSQVGPSKNSCFLVVYVQIFISPSKHIFELFEQHLKLLNFLLCQLCINLDALWICLYAKIQFNKLLFFNKNPTCYLKILVSYPFLYQLCYDDNRFLDLIF
jgi:hypothetical protein